MNFPLELPIFQFLYWLVNTAGIGGFLVMLVGGSSILTYSLTLYWITRGGKDDDTESYTYPTPALHTHHEE